MALIPRRTLDWRPRFDPRSLEHRIGAGVTAYPTTGRLWQHGPVLDQGAEGACVGFGCAGEAAAEPVPVPGVTDAYALAYYRRCQQLDAFPDTVDGSSVLAGCLTGRERGLWAGFQWAKSAQELAAGIVRTASKGGGPAIIGVPWTADSYDTDELGVLRPSGEAIGGHCLVVLGFIPERVEDGSKLQGQLMQAGLWNAYLSVGGPAFVILNSWGLGFGQGGLAVVPAEVMERWVHAGGEFALPVDRGAGVLAAWEVEDMEDALGASPDETLHVLGRDVQVRDRIVAGLPADLGQETTTVRGRRVLSSWRGRLVRITSTAGVFTLGASDPVTVRRPT